MCCTYRNLPEISTLTSIRAPQQSAAPVAIGGIGCLTATAEIDLLPLLYLKSDWQVATTVMGFVTKRQMLRPSASAPVIGAGSEGYCNRHPGIDIYIAHHTLLLIRNVSFCLVFWAPQCGFEPLTRWQTVILCEKFMLLCPHGNS